MDVLAPRALHAPVRVLTHIRKLDDALGHFRGRITCQCGAARECEPEALACGSSATLEAVGKRTWCSKCGAKDAEVVAIPVQPPWRRSLRRSESGEGLPSAKGRNSQCGWHWRMTFGTVRTISAVAMSWPWNVINRPHTQSSRRNKVSLR